MIPTFRVCHDIGMRRIVVAQKNIVFWNTRLLSDCCDPDSLLRHLKRLVVSNGHPLWRRATVLPQFCCGSAAALVTFCSIHTLFLQRIGAAPHPALEVLASHDANKFAIQLVLAVQFVKMFVSSFFALQLAAPEGKLDCKRKTIMSSVGERIKEQRSKLG